MMYAKEAPSLLDRYTLAKSFGFKGVECAFPYEFSKEDLIKVTNLRLWSFMVFTKVGKDVFKTCIIQVLKTSLKVGD